jgi:rhodanese-related sulfurtransferase
MRLAKFFILALIVLGVTAMSSQGQTVDPRTLPVQMISAEELKTKVTDNQALTIIDVRSSEGYAASSSTIKGAMHFKLRRLKSRLLRAPLKDLPKDREIVTYCACPNDESSIAAAQIFQESGFKRVKVLQGGWQEWLKAKGPVAPRAKS